MGRMIAARGDKREVEKILQLFDAVNDFDPRFRTLTVKLFQDLPPQEAPWAIQQHVLMKIQEDEDRAPEILASMAPGVRAVYAALALDIEVKNGGFNQFFWNRPHHVVGYALEGLDYVGAAQHAAHLRDAMDRAVAERQRLMPYHVEGSLEAFSASYHEGVFEELDTSYYGLPDLLDILARAIQTDPQRFCSP
jgi:hypothetical protein